MEQIDRLWKCVAGDFDQDGWYEMCGWDEHTLHALDLVDKRILWQAFAGSPDDYDLFVGPGRIYVNTANELLALDAATGQRLWSIGAGNVREVHDPGVAGGVIWVGIADEQLVALDRATGAKRADWPMNDSASLFRKLVGQHLVWNDASALCILEPMQSRSILQIGAGGSIKDMMQAAMKPLEDLAAGRRVDPASLQVPDSVGSAIVHRGIVYVHVMRGRGTPVLDAYRASDGKLVARRQLDRDELELIGAVGGHPLSRTDERVLRREPDGPTWTAPGNEAEIAFAGGVGAVLVVLAKRRDMGIDSWDLTGLDGTTLAQLWRVENLGYVYGDLAYDDSRVIVTIQGDGTQKLVAFDVATGTRLWEAQVPREEGTLCAGGLVWQKRYGTTVLAETGQMIFPTDQRTATPPPPTPRTFITDEVPDWGTVKSAAAPAKKSSSTLIFVILAVLVVAAIAVVAIVKMKK